MANGSLSMDAWFSIVSNAALLPMPPAHLSALASSANGMATSWDAPTIIFLKLLAILFLVLLNGFFAASEFAIVKGALQPARGPDRPGQPGRTPCPARYRSPGRLPFRYTTRYYLGQPGAWLVG